MKVHLSDVVLKLSKPSSVPCHFYYSNCEEGMKYESAKMRK